MFWNKKDDSIENGPKMNMIQRLAMKKIMNMDPKEREKLIQQVTNPEFIAKNKDKILDSMTKMHEQGSLTQQQLDDARKKLGIE
jgi:hypothetical protein